MSSNSSPLTDFPPSWDFFFLGRSGLALLSLLVGCEAARVVDFGLFSPGWRDCSEGGGRGVEDAEEGGFFADAFPFAK